MPKPFPWPLNVGTDICYIPRILGILSGNTGPNFVRRILTVEERNHYQGRVDWPLSKWQESARRQKQIEWKRNEIGLSQLELAHCYDLKKSGRMGKPSAWLQQFRSQIHADAASGGKNEAAASVSTQSLKSSNIYGADTEPTPLGSLGLFRETAMETSAHLLDGDTTRIDEEAVSSTAKNGSDDLDVMLRLMHESDEATQEAKKALRKAAEFMAGRFAAKEAAIKAHHKQRLTYHRISILPDPFKRFEGSGPPIAVVIPEDGELQDGQEVKISISHDGDYATAVCLACDPEDIAKPKSKKDVAPEGRELQ